MSFAVAADGVPETSFSQNRGLGRRTGCQTRIWRLGILFASMCCQPSREIYGDPVLLRYVLSGRVL